MNIWLLSVFSCFFFVPIVQLHIGPGGFRGRPLTHGPVFLAGLGARGTRNWLYGGCQCTEESSDEGQTQTAPSAEHGPAVAVTDVVREAVYVTWVTGQLEVDSCHAGAQGNDAKCAWKKKEKIRMHSFVAYCLCRQLIFKPLTSDLVGMHYIGICVVKLILLSLKLCSNNYKNALHTNILVKSSVTGTVIYSIQNHFSLKINWISYKIIKIKSRLFDCQNVTTFRHSTSHNLTYSTVSAFII